MKKTTLLSGIAALLAVLMLFSLAGCSKEEPQNGSSAVQNAGIWENAVYTQDKEFGNGKTTVKVEVKADDRSVTFTVKTDKETLGDALLEHGLIAGDQGEYGLYVKTVNGIVADYDADQHYWAFYQDGEYLQTGIDAVKPADGAHYEIVYAK